MRLLMMAAIDRKRALGRNGELLYSIPEDMQRFKRLTLGQRLILGRKTLESFPNQRPLPGREHWLLTRKPERYPGIRCFQSSDELLTALNEFDGSEGLSLSSCLDLEAQIPVDAIVIGGASVYQIFLKHAEFLDLCEMDAEFPDADCYFPEFEAAYEL
ncbi:MAG: dihydrofolate reductase, partial [Eubacteriales bacterium]|nr:dihydrofolate reductase [Eubacteriales bacterium]